MLFLVMIRRYGQLLRLEFSNRMYLHPSLQWSQRRPLKVARDPEEQLEDARAALRASEAARLELSADYKHVLGQLWKANAEITRRER